MHPLKIEIDRLISGIQLTMFVSIDAQCRFRTINFSHNQYIHIDESSDVHLGNLGNSNLLDYIRSMEMELYLSLHNFDNSNQYNFHRISYRLE